MRIEVAILYSGVTCVRLHLRWDRENAAANRFFPGWEQEAADLDLHVMLQEHMTDIVTVVKLMHHENVIYISMNCSKDIEI